LDPSAAGLSDPTSGSFTGAGVKNEVNPSFLALAPSIQCVINLSVQFFLVYLFTWALITLRDFTGYEWALLTQTVENLKAVVQFCPILSILFVATRMRALQITDYKGAPQGWAQDGMYLSSWAVLIQLLACIATPIVAGEPTRIYDQEHDPWKAKHPLGLLLAQVMRWGAFLCLYFGIVTVVVSIYLITPETANGRVGRAVALQHPELLDPSAAALLPSPEDFMQPAAGSSSPLPVF